jgi:hypothetical protein
MVVPRLAKHAAGLADAAAGSILGASIETEGITATQIDDGTITYAELDEQGKLLRFPMRHAVAEATAATDFEKSIVRIPVAGTVKAVYLVPDAGFGQDTNYSTLAIINKGGAGAGSTSVASKAFNAANAVAAYVPASLTLSVTPADLIVAAGDVLTLKKTHSASGQLVPLCEVAVYVERSA